MPPVWGQDCRGSQPSGGYRSTEKTGLAREANGSQKGGGSAQLLPFTCPPTSQHGPPLVEPAGSHFSKEPGQLKESSL